MRSLSETVGRRSLKFMVPATLNGVILGICGVRIPGWRFWVLTIWTGLLWITSPVVNKPPNGA